MINFLMENEKDVQSMFKHRNQYTPKLVQLPFDQNLKRKVTVRSIENNESQVRLYIKGAPEYVIKLCNFTYGKNGPKTTFSESDQQYILQEKVSE